MAKKGAGGGDVDITFNATLGGTAKADLDAIKSELSKLTNKTYKIKVSVDDAAALKQIANMGLAISSLQKNMQLAQAGVKNTPIANISKQFSSMQRNLEAMRKTLGQIGNKKLGTTFDFGSFNQEHVDAYKEQVMSYARGLGEAYKTVKKIQRMPEFSKSLKSGQHDLVRQAVVAAGDYEQTLKSIQKRMASVKTVTGAETVAKDIAKYWEPITKIYDHAKSIGILGKDAKTPLFPQKPSGAITSLEALVQAAGGLQLNVGKANISADKTAASFGKVTASAKSAGAATEQIATATKAAAQASKQEATVAKETAAATKAAATEQQKAVKQIDKSQVKKSSSKSKSGLTGAIKLQTAELQTQKQLLSEMMGTVTGARRTIKNSPLLGATQKADELGRLKLLMDDINRYQNATKTLGYNSPKAMQDITKQVDGVRQRVKALKEEEDASKRVATAEKNRAKAAQQQEQKYWKDYAARRKAWEQEIAKTSRDTTSKTGQSAAKQVTDTKRMLSDLKSIEKNILSKPLANGDRQSQSLGYIKSLREELERFPNANSAMASNMQSRLNNISKLVEGYRATENAAKSAAQAQAKESAAAEKASAKQAAAFERQTASMQKRIQQFMDKNPRVAGTSYEQQLQTLTGQMDARVSSGKGTAKDLKGYEDQFKRIKAAAADAGKVGQTLGQSIAGAVKQFGGWMLVTHSIMTVINTIKGMIANVRDLDKEMTELKKVTNETDSAYEEFFDRAKVRAKETGATLTDTIRASSDMARLGYSIPDAEKMADAATIYKNVGDGIENIDEASQSIISSIKAFGMEATDSLQIVDRFNEVGRRIA